MVSKKKVNKRVVISGDEDAKKPISKKQKVEQINIAAPITQEKILQPGAELLHIEPINKPVVAEPIIEVPDTEPMQIFGDDKKESNGNVEIVRPEKESNILKIIGVGLCLIVVVFWLIVLTLSVEVHTGPKITERNITIIKKVSTPLSFDNIINESTNDLIKKQSSSEEISLQGMLRKEKINTTPEGSIGIPSSREETYVVDDGGRKVIARVKPSQKAEYASLFTNNTKVKTAYTVTGIYRYALTDFILEVTSIEPYTRVLSEVNEQKLENYTIPDVKGADINITKGWTKISALINPVKTIQNITDS